MKRRWNFWLKRIWLSPWLIALIVSGLIIFFLPDFFHKYRSSLIRSGFIDKKGGFEYYPDLDDDGTSERVILFNNTEALATVKIIGKGNFISDHFYFRGQFTGSRKSFFAGIFDSTRHKIAFLLTRSSDSLLLHAWVPATRETICSDLYITTIPSGTQNKDLSVELFGLHDLDRDGTFELLFQILNGFPLRPRAIYAFNIKKQQLLQSPLMGAFSGIKEAADINSDGFPEIITASYAISNDPDTMRIPYHDSMAWLMVLDHNLEFFFKPVGFRGKYTTVDPVSIRSGINTALATMVYSLSPGEVHPALHLYDHSGKLLKERIIDDTLQMRKYRFYKFNGDTDKLFLIRDNGLIDVIDHRLITVEKKQVSGVIHPWVQLMDVDGDGHDELVFTEIGLMGTIVARGDLSHPLAMPIPTQEIPIYYDIVQRENKDPMLFGQQGNRYWICSYEKNPVYYFRFPAYIVIYMVVLGFVWFIQYIQRRAIRQKFETENRLTTLQLLLVKNQVDPHFTFNAINTVSAAILQQRPDEANQSLLLLSKLIRSCVENAERLTRSVGEELEFVNNYLDLSRQRMGSGFEYKIAIDDDVDLQWQVPRMVVQIHTENALKHGFSKISGNKTLVIRALIKEKMLVLEIQDNGIGREEAGKRKSDGTGKGTKIMEQLFAIINRYNTRKLKSEIIDLKDATGSPSGTLVRIFVPEEMNFDIA